MCSDLHLLELRLVVDVPRHHRVWLCAEEGVMSHLKVYLVLKDLANETYYTLARMIQLYGKFC